MTSFWVCDADCVRCRGEGQVSDWRWDSVTGMFLALLVSCPNARVAPFVFSPAANARWALRIFAGGSAWTGSRAAWRGER